MMDARDNAAKDDPAYMLPWAIEARHLERSGSPLELLPDEIQLQIMAQLDFSTLYCLSRTSPRFLRLSFDNIFEENPEWRTFRHTVDEVNGGRAFGLGTDPVYGTSQRAA